MQGWVRLTRCLQHLTQVLLTMESLLQGWVGLTSMTCVCNTRHRSVHNGESTAGMGGADKHDLCLQHLAQVLLTVESLKSIQAEMNSYTAQMSPSKITYLNSNGIYWLLVPLLYLE